MDEDIKDQIARPLGQVPSGCFILTAAHQDRSAGMLASWAQQAAFEPPMMSVAVKRGRPIADLIEASGHFVLNALAEDPIPMFKHFGKGFALGEPAFEGLTTRVMPAGVVIEECIAHLACRLHAHVDASDHRIYLGEIIGGASHRPGKPYVHLRSNGFKY
jgi:flavin reductase (DIM6/NTAB) family NADH-FMN oxidoreductase RutF